MKLTQGGAIRWDQGGQLRCVAHLIFIEDPSDINTLMKLARWPGGTSYSGNIGRNKLMKISVENALYLKDRIWC